MPWTLFVAVLMISSLPTFTWTSLRIRRGWRLPALAGVALLGAALLNEPWLTLLVVSAIYLALIPFSIVGLRPGQAAARSRGRMTARCGRRSG